MLRLPLYEVRRDTLEWNSKGYNCIKCDLKWNFSIIQFSQFSSYSLCLSMDLQSPDRICATLSVSACLCVRWHSAPFSPLQSGVSGSLPTTAAALTFLHHSHTRTQTPRYFENLLLSSICIIYAQALCIFHAQLIRVVWCCTTHALCSHTHTHPSHKVCIVSSATSMTCIMTWLHTWPFDSSPGTSTHAVTLKRDIRMCAFALRAQKHSVRKSWIRGPCWLSSPVDTEKEADAETATC